MHLSHCPENTGSKDSVAANSNLLLFNIVLSPKAIGLYR